MGNNRGDDNPRRKLFRMLIRADNSKLLKNLARRTGRFPQLVDPRSSVNGLLLTGSPGFRMVGPWRSAACPAATFIVTRLWLRPHGSCPDRPVFPSGGLPTQFTQYRVRPLTSLRLCALVSECAIVFSVHLRTHDQGLWTALAGGRSLKEPTLLRGRSASERRIPSGG